MKKSKTVAQAVMMTLVSASLAGGSLATMASSKYVKCYGIAKKGKNDCGTSRHPCAGHAKRNYLPDEWVYVKKSTCLKKGGSIGKPVRKKKMKY